MAKGESETSNVSSNTLINFENYNQFFYAFKVTHEKANSPFEQLLERHE